MASTETMRKWYLDWSKTPATQTALNLFKDIGITGDNVNIITQERIVIACFNATHYNAKNDPSEIYRDKIRAEKKKIKQLQNAAHILAISAGHNDRALSWAHDIADDKSGVRITRKDHSTPKEHHLVMQDYFLQLEIALGGKLPELNGGPFKHRFTVGNLISDKAISRGRKITAETMLAFEIAFYIRMYTAGRATDGWQYGQGMSDDGNPCFPVVASFCNAVFGSGWDGKQIGDNVRDLKNMGLKSWQGVNSD